MPSSRPPLYSPGDWRQRNSRRTPRDRVRARTRRTVARRVIATLALLAASGLFAGGLALAVLFAWGGRDLPDPSRLIVRQVPQSTTIYDRTGTVLLYEIHGQEQRTQLTLDAIAPTAKWATIAVEDKNFYAHRGFRLRSVLRALLVNALRGGRVQGGSTITQQLIKNAILSPEKTYRRKVKELLLAERLEQRFTKDEILTMYFNEIPYGSTAYGIEAASRMILGKSARDLDLAESALLAAIPKAPTYYSPYGTHREELAERTRFILDLMVEQGYVTRAEADAAKAVDILARVQPKREAITAPHFVMYVRELLTDRYGERAVEQGGLRVTTTLDAGMQEVAEAAVEQYGERNAKSYHASNAALVALDVPTGQIRAMVGSRDYFNDAIHGQVNVALRPRQPGSSFKPIVYAAAFARGYTPETLLEDVATTFPTPVGMYEPANYDGKERGIVTIRKALAGSLNIPAVKALYLVGLDAALDLAARLGYTTFADRSRFGLSLVLGGGEVRLLEHTAAYAALAADGVRRPTSAILRVEGPDGGLLEEWEPPEGQRVLDAEVVRAITGILSDNDARSYVFGANSPLAFTDRPVAAKTGTTNDWHDAWTMGYTPSLAVGVWVGNSDNRAMKQKSDGSYVAAPIWRAFLDTVLKGKPAEAFTPSEPVAVGKSVLRGEVPPATRIRIDRTTGARATDATPADHVEERTYQALHTILTYVRRDDPRGPLPERPEDDPMYRPWEDALASWAERNRIVTTALPTDELHAEVNRPTLAVTEPAAGATIPTRTFAVVGTASAPRGVRRIEVRVDGIAAALLPGSDGAFRADVRLPTVIGRGPHELRVTAFDDVGNAYAVTVVVEVATDREPVALTWVQPTAGATLHAADFPYALTIAGADVTGVTRLELRITDARGERALTSVVPATDGPTRILWPRPATDGAVELHARLLVGDLIAGESAALTITIAP